MAGEMQRDRADNRSRRCCAASARLASARSAVSHRFDHASVSACRAGAALVVGVLGLLAACDRATDPGQPVRTSITSVRVFQGTVRAVASDSGGVIQIKGVIGTPQPCYSQTASASRRLRSLSVVLYDTAPSSGTCTNWLAAFKYEVQLLDLDAGPYTVRFLYRHQSPSNPDIDEPVLDTTITLRAP